MAKYYIWNKGEEPTSTTYTLEQAKELFALDEWTEEDAEEKAAWEAINDTNSLMAFVNKYVNNDNGIHIQDYTIEEVKEISERTEPNYIQLMMEDLRKSREEFARDYGIPKRTLESWYYEERKCPDYVINLLANTVYAGIIKAVPVYRVYEINDFGSGDEWESMITKSYKDAISEARSLVRINRETKSKAIVEIRLYSGDPDEVVDYEPVRFV